MNKNIYKLKKIGLGKFTLSFLSFCLFLLLFLYANINMTPKSISVSGYYRNDGTYVRSYNRRPPGAVLNDRPFEALKTIASFGSITSGVYLYILFRRYNNSHAIDFLKKDIIWVEDYPPQDFTLISVPEYSAVPRKCWTCDVCKNKIYPGSIYFYYAKNSKSNRHHICNGCRDHLSILYRVNMDKKNNYVREVKIIRKKRANQLAIEYRREFGEELNDPENYL